MQITLEAVKKKFKNYRHEEASKGHPLNYSFRRARSRLLKELGEAYDALLSKAERELRNEMMFNSK